MDWPLVSVILVSYNNERHLWQCLTSLETQAYPHCEVIVVDNASTDGGPALVAREFPAVTLLRNADNPGFAQACNQGARHANGHYLAFLNPDTTVATDWLAVLVRALESDPTVGLVTPKILLLDNPDRIDTCANEVHLTGLTASRGWGQPASAYDEPETVCAISGAAFVMSKRVFEEIGGFDGAFFMYYEDTDLSWRAQLAGYICAYVPDAVVYHEHSTYPSPGKYFYLERNRARMLLKNLRWPTLTVLLVPLLLTELVTWGYALIEGRQYVRNKLSAYRWLATHRPDLLASRRAVQRRRRAPDRRILHRCTYRLPYDLASVSPAARLARWVLDPAFWVLRVLCLALIRW